MKKMNTPTTLYRPEFEHDACGVGFIARKTGQPGHDILEMALESVCCMKHRAGIDADGQSGDGAGILTQIPHRLLAEEIDGLPSVGDYALLMLFLPQDNIEQAKTIVYETLAAMLFPDEPTAADDMLIWRKPPLDVDALGETARRTSPHIIQLIVKRPAHIERGEVFERFLYTARKKLEAEARGLELGENFYVASISSRTVIYKGLMLSPALDSFYLDLQNELYETALAVIHTRYSTNTSSSWPRAQPFRMVAHNGEINTLQGNVNWMKARESNIQSPHWDGHLESLRPVIDETGSDSGQLDNVLELLVHAGRDLHHSMAMLAPEAWENIPDINPDVEAFYRYHAGLMEPWDGPAAVVFSDGARVGVTLDRNGLRPMRYFTTSNDLIIANSEAGAVTIDESLITRKGRLGPGHMIYVDLERKLFLTNEQVKRELGRRQPYQEWVENFKPLYTESRPAYFSLNGHHQTTTLQPKVNTNPTWLTRLQVAFGYTNEEMTVILRPMAKEGKEPTGSMGDDTPLAVLSPKPRPLFHFFKQRFAQVTNPPIDPLRETFVMSLTTRLGSRPNLLEETPKHASLVELTSPVLSDADLAALKGLGDPRFEAKTIATRYPVTQGEDGLKRGLDRLCRMAEQAIDEGKTILILSDVGVNHDYAPIPSLLAVGAVHHHLVRIGKRMRVSIVLESGEVREVHHIACVIGYGANAVNPYLALATIDSLVEAGKIKLSATKAKTNFVKAMEAGLLKIMSKMGLSVVESYCGAQIFEAVGLGQELIDEYFAGTVSRLGGIGLKEIAAEVKRWHKAAFDDPDKASVDSPGFYKFKRGGEPHSFNPGMVKALHKAVRMDDVLNKGAYQEFTPTPPNGKRRAVHNTRSFLGEKFVSGYEAYRKFVKATDVGEAIDPRDMLGFVAGADRQPIPIEEVESIEDIFMRFSTAAMSHGALSSEAHETLAVAMNRIGAMSNSGEGGSAKHRFGNERNDRVKQVASGRFGVTPDYLMSADELQIKMAQGAKPGEGGQLPGHKVSAEIASIRHTTEGTTLISPPPHHDIYSIEDLAQLIYDLKQINPTADVSVKLVSEAGVGTVASGVVKGGADVVHIAGHSGGTGAAAWSSIKNVGLPWELGLAEVHQTLVQNNLRDRVRVRTDGGLQTGRDVVIASILGADEFSFGTAALVAEGCLMARACHNNTCPVGVATQRPELRAKFAGTPEHVIAYMHYVAHEVQEILAELGFRHLDEIVGRTDLLEQIETGNTQIDMLTMAPLLAKAMPSLSAEHVVDSGVTALGDLNKLLLEKAQPAIKEKQHVQLTLPINNTDRTVGATISGAIAQQYGVEGLPDGTIDVTFRGSAGQAFGAFTVKGVNLTLIGEANDYVGKGMNDGQIVIRPPMKSQIVASDSIIMGNTVLYGATGGSLFAAGRAGERFAVRNSGAVAVVEGVGDHGCEYMTSGLTVILGPTGYNFGAGMSGGMAFVLDEGHYLPQRINSDMVQIVRVTSSDDIEILRHLIQKHVRLTDSVHGKHLLDNWSTQLGRFWKVAPKGTVGSTGKRTKIHSSQVLNLSENVVG